MTSNRRPSWTWFVLSWALAACQTNVETPSALALSSGEGPTPERREGDLITTVDRDTLRAGENLYVTCRELRGGQAVLPTGPVDVFLLPVPGHVATHSNDVAVPVTLAGSFVAKCQVRNEVRSDPVGAPFVVSPAEPHHWSVAITPAACYAQELPLPIGYEVYDRYDNIIEAPLMQLSTTPATAVQMVDGGWQIRAEGHFNISLAVTGPRAPDAILPPFSADITVDSTPPNLTLSTPARGAMLLMGGIQDVSTSVTGMTTDVASGVARVTVNGSPVTVAASGGFTTAVNSRWGVNLITTNAFDACGNVASTSHAYLRSGAYRTASTEPSSLAQVPRAAVVQINQPLLDDGHRSSLDDLASLGEFMARQQDVNDHVLPGEVLASNPLRSDCSNVGDNWVDGGYTVWRHPNASYRVTLDGPWVEDLQFVAGGTRFWVTVGAVDFPLKITARARECATGQVAEQSITLSAWVGLDGMSAEGVLAAAMASGRLRVQLAEFEVDLDRPYLNLDCGDLDWVCDEATEYAISRTTHLIEDALAEAVLEGVAPILEQAGNQTTLTREIALPPPLNVTLGVQASLDQVLFCGGQDVLVRPTACPVLPSHQGFGKVALRAQVYPTSRGLTVPPNARGAISYGGPLPAFSSVASDAGVAMSLDAINQALWATWYSGALHVADLQSMPGSNVPPGIDLDVDFGLPPVMMPGRNGNLVELGIGEVRATAYLSPAAWSDLIPNPDSALFIDLVGSAVVGAEIKLDSTSNHLEVRVGQNPSFAVQLVSYLPQERFIEGALSVKMMQVLNQAIPRLLERATTSIPLPEMDMRAAGLPVRGSWQLRNGNVSGVSSYVTATGSLGTGP